MKWKEWMYAGLGAVAGAASLVLAKWLRERLKSRWFGHLLGKNEKEHLAKAVREFLKEYKEEDKEK